MEGGGVAHLDEEAGAWHTSAVHLTACMRLLGRLPLCLMTGLLNRRFFSVNHPFDLHHRIRSPHRI